MTLLESLKRHARARHGEISPCAGRTWRECITFVAGRWILWYNSRDGSTHVIREGVDTVAESCYYQDMEEHNGRH